MLLESIYIKVFLQSRLSVWGEYIDNDGIFILVHIICQEDEYKKNEKDSPNFLRQLRCRRSSIVNDKKNLQYKCYQLANS